MAEWYNILFFVCFFLHFFHIKKQKRKQWEEQHTKEVYKYRKGLVCPPAVKVEVSSRRIGRLHDGSFTVLSSSMTFGPSLDCDSTDLQKHKRDPCGFGKRSLDEVVGVRCWGYVCCKYGVVTCVCAGRSEGLFVCCCWCCRSDWNVGWVLELEAWLGWLLVPDATSPCR